MKKLMGLVILFLGSISLLAHAVNSNSVQKQQDSTTTAPSKLTIGEYYQGGVIFWLDPTQSNKHGLIVEVNDAPSTAKAGYAWDTRPPQKTGARGNKVYAGKNNTKLIIAVIGSERAQAAYACVSNKNQGYSDWYLPSKYELDLLLKKQRIVESGAKAHEGSALGNHAYWSSTEYARNSAYNLSFGYGGKSHAATYRKNNPLNVRCIRAF